MGKVENMIKSIARLTGWLLGYLISHSETKREKASETYCATEGAWKNCHDSFVTAQSYCNALGKKSK